MSDTTPSDWAAKLTAEHPLLLDGTTAVQNALEMLDRQFPLEKYSFGEIAQVVASLLLNTIEDVVPDRILALQAQVAKMRDLSGNLVAEVSMFLQGLSLSDAEAAERQTLLNYLREVQVMMRSSAPV